MDGKTGTPWFSFVLVHTVVLFHRTGFYGTYRQSFAKYIANISIFVCVLK